MANLHLFYFRITETKTEAHWGQLKVELTESVSLQTVNVDLD